MSYYFKETVTNAKIDGDPFPPGPVADGPYSAIPLDGYSFVFFALDGFPNSPDPGALVAYCEGVDTLIAWYHKKTTGPRPSPDQAAVKVFTFSMGQDRFLSEGPVAAADPVSAYDGLHVWTKDQAVSLTAKDSVGIGSLGEPFSMWWILGSVVDSSSVTIPQKSDGFAIAFFGQQKPVDYTFPYWLDRDPAAILGEPFVKRHSPDPVVFGLQPGNIVLPVWRPKMKAILP